MFLLLNFWNNESSKYICEINFLASKWTLYRVYRVEKELILFCVLSLKVSWAKAPGHNILWISPGEAYSIFAYFSRPLFHSQGPFVVIFFMLYKKVMPEPNYTCCIYIVKYFFSWRANGEKIQKMAPLAQMRIFFLYDQQTMIWEVSQRFWILQIFYTHTLDILWSVEVKFSTNTHLKKNS